MRLDISLDKKYYKSDSLKNGRLAATFFETLSNNMFKQACKYWKKRFEITGSGELPLIFGERFLYSNIAVAINDITPIHLSECSFNLSDYEELDKNRRVDFWCLNKNGDNGNPINYWIEVKKRYYCLNERSMEKFEKKLIMTLLALLNK